MKTVVILFMLSLVLTLLSIPGCSGANNVQTELPPPRPADIGKGRLINLSRINSIHDEFAPCISLHGTELILTSNRPRDLEPKMLDPEFRYGEALYTSIGKGTNWNEPTLLNPVSSFAEVNTGTMVSHGSGHVSYLSATYKKEGSGSADILVVMKNDDGYSELRPLMEINSLWWDSHPAVSPDGQIMIFSSDRSKDPLPTETETKRNPHLWMSKKQGDGSWSSPVRLPEPVNSDASEISPHFGSDGFLYFASNRNPDRRFDIFRVKMRLDGGWDSLGVLDEPVNSAFDDCFPWLSSDGSAMYFASNRPGGLGGYDLWAAECYADVTLEVRVVLIENDGREEPGANVIVYFDENSDPVGRTNADGIFAVPIDVCERYVVSVGSEKCYEIENRKQEFQSGNRTALKATESLTFRLRRKAPGQISTFEDDVPYFVTGYWKPNTSENFRALLTRMTRDERGKYYFPGSRFIDAHDLETVGGYEIHTKRIDEKFVEIERAIGAAVRARSDECSPIDKPLEILVIGYVDPLGLAWGLYPDETVKTMTVRLEDGTVLGGRTIEQNAVMSDSLGNVRLSHLRAYYTYKQIDAMMRVNPEYAGLFQRGMVKWSYTGGYIPPPGRHEYRADPMKRRFEIRIR